MNKIHRTTLNIYIINIIIIILSVDTLPNWLSFQCIYVKIISGVYLHIHIKRIFISIITLFNTTLEVSKVFFNIFYICVCDNAIPFTFFKLLNCLFIKMIFRIFSKITPNPVCIF